MLEIEVSPVLQMSWMLLGCHIFGDWVFQSHIMATEKSRHSESEIQKSVKWYWWLSAHGLIHGMLITYFTGIILLGILETFSHIIIDYGKSEGMYGMPTDQILHVLCKGIWLYLIYGSLPWVG